MTRLRALALVVGAVLAPALVLSQTQAAEAFVPPPVIPVAPSVLGGTATATGGGVTLAGAATVTGVAAAATAVFFGTAYGTYSVLNWAFSGSTETAGPQPVPSNYPGLSLPLKMFTICTIAGYTGSIPQYIPTGWTVSTCATTTPTVGGTVSISGTAPAWRCANGSTACGSTATGVRAATILKDGTIAGGGISCAAFSGASGSAGSFTCSATTTQSDVNAGGYGGVILYDDPAYYEWSPAPLHKWRIITTCKNKTTGATTTSTNYSALFTEADTVPANIQVPQCQAGWIGTRLEVWEGDSNGNGGIQRYVWTAPTDTGLVTPTSPYKSCYPGGTDAPCTLSLYKVLTDGQLVQCSATVNCTDYDPITSTTTQYRCFWGTHSMPLTDCAALQQWTDQTGDTSTATPTVTTTVTTSTGTSLPTEGAIPTVPTTGSEDSEQSCLQGAWSWNPVSWVYIPVKCALKWAFVPNKTAVDAEIASTRAALDNSAPGKWVTAIGTVSGDMGATEAGCLGPHIAWGRLPDGGFYPFKACDGIMATVAGACHLIATVMVTFFGGLACLRALGAGLGWNPGIGRHAD